MILSLILAVSTVAAAEDISFDQSDLEANDDELTLSIEEDFSITEDEQQSLMKQNDDSEKLTAGNTFSDLKNEITEQLKTSTNIKLSKSNYAYNTGSTTIEITKSCTIDCNGAVIDMTGSTIQAFLVTASDVTIKNLTIKNVNFDGNGGAIYFGGSGNVTNCNFTNNIADYGGTIRMGEGTVTNCNFTNNSAKGGAIYSQQWYTAADTCIFKANSGENVNVVIFPLH